MPSNNRRAAPARRKRAAGEIVRRQIDAIERPAREAAEREAAQTRNLIDELARSIAEFGDERAKFASSPASKPKEASSPEPPC
jgi:hypothetical protein